MDDPRAAAGVEHLQSAAREFLKAARSFLDVVEDVVEDPDRLTGAAAGLVDVVRQGLGRQDAPWVSAAWDAPFEDEPTSPTDTAEEHTVNEPVPDEPVPDEPVPDEPVPSTRTTTRRRASTTAAGTSRVRRIAVD